jgi:hypothetical protein
MIEYLTLALPYEHSYTYAFTITWIDNFAKSVYPYPIWKKLKCINLDQIDILFEIYLIDILKLIYLPNIGVEGRLLFPRHLIRLSMLTLFI